MAYVISGGLYHKVYKRADGTYYFIKEGKRVALGGRKVHARKVKCSTKKKKSCRASKVCSYKKSKKTGKRSCKRRSRKSKSKKSRK